MIIQNDFLSHIVVSQPPFIPLLWTLIATFTSMKKCGKHQLLTLVFLICSCSLLTGQSDSLSFWQPSPTFNKSRFTKALTFSSVAYTGFSTGLYLTWYKQYPTEGFQLFNDMGEWKQVDKVGHVYTAYLQGVLCYKGAKWTGLSEGQSILTGVICGTLFQTTIEVMDGFSAEWGFSVGDFAANTIGTGAFALQQKFWGEQRIILKESSWARNYSNDPITSVSGNATSSLDRRANNLFGSGFFERYLKDYNGQTYWASFNVHSFLPKSNTFPKWLNVALGYGAQGLWGGFENQWEEDNQQYILDLPRYRQWYLSLDMDLTKLDTDNYFLKTLLSILNIIKIPAPAIEINTQGQIKLHLLHF